MKSELKKSWCFQFFFGRAERTLEPAVRAVPVAGHDHQRADRDGLVGAAVAAGMLLHFQPGGHVGHLPYHPPHHAGRRSSQGSRLRPALLRRLPPHVSFLFHCCRADPLGQLGPHEGGPAGSLSAVSSSSSCK